MKKNLVDKMISRYRKENDENGGHGYIEHAAIGNKVIHVFRADDNDGDKADDR